MLKVLSYIRMVTFSPTHLCAMYVLKSVFHCSFFMMMGFSKLQKKKKIPNSSHFKTIVVSTEVISGYE